MNWLLDLLQTEFMLEKEIELENQNSDYYGLVGYSNLLNDKIRVRVAKKTPTKPGYFVSFWEKDEMGKNVPFTNLNSPEWLVVLISDNGKYGYFQFCKSILIEKNILTSCGNLGKMGMRVYPDWCTDLNQTATKTQKWQMDYFKYLS